MLSLLIEDVTTGVNPHGFPAASTDADFAPVAPLPVEQVHVARILALRRNDVLYEAGDLKTNLYRIETGALCIYVTHRDRTHEVIEFALAGDIVGMGFLERHASNARAVVDTTIACLPIADIDRLTANDARAKARFHDAVEREFAFRRDYISNAGRPRPLAQLAAFLVAVSHQNESEGRDPAFIDDTLECAVVAGYLGMSVDALKDVLVKLGDLGLVQPMANRGLQITDMERLQALADDDIGTVLQSDLPDERGLLPGS